MHINEAVLHEYLDRGADAGGMSDVDTHLNECASCRLLLDSVIKERSAASAILRAAAPTGMARPSFESLLPRPKFETLEGAHNTDVAFDHQVQYKQVTLGMRGQAIAWLWAASIVVSIGVGAFAMQMYQQEAAHAARVAQVADSAAKAHAITTGDSVMQAATPPQDSISPLQVASSTRRNPEPASHVPAATTATANIDQSNATNAGAPPAAAEASVPPMSQAPMSKFDPRIGDNSVTRTGIGGKAAADKPIRSTELVGSVNLDAYPDTLTASVIGMPRDEWKTVSADSALAVLGGQMIRARGLRVIDYAVSSGTSTGSVPRVRVRQRIASNDTLEIFQTPPRAPDRTTAPEQMTSRATRNALQKGAFHNVAGGSYFRRYYVTMRSPDDRVVTVIAGRAKSVNDWRPELTSLTRD